MDDVRAALGEPESKGDPQRKPMWSYSLKPFKRVDFTARENKLASIVIHLEKPTPVAAIVGQINLAGVLSAPVTDDAGTLIGEVFPERGVLLSLTGDKLATHVLLEAIDPKTFLLRAESTPGDQQRLKDLAVALSMDASLPAALRLRAETLLGLGRHSDAIKAAAEASTAPQDPLCRLTHAKVVGRIGQIEAAMRETESVLSASSTPIEPKARAQCQLGELISAGPADFTRAPWPSTSRPSIWRKRCKRTRRPRSAACAKETLVEAHLGMARCVAAGRWKQKEQVTPKWLTPRRRACRRPHRP